MELNRTVRGSLNLGMLALVKQPKYPGSALMRLIPTLEQELHVQSLSLGFQTGATSPTATLQQ